MIHIRSFSQGPLEMKVGLDLGIDGEHEHADFFQSPFPVVERGCPVDQDLVAFAGYGEGNLDRVSLTVHGKGSGSDLLSWVLAGLDFCKNELSGGIGFTIHPLSHFPVPLRFLGIEGVEFKSAPGRKNRQGVRINIDRAVKVLGHCGKAVKSGSTVGTEGGVLEIDDKGTRRSVESSE